MISFVGKGTLSPLSIETIRVFTTKKLTRRPPDPSVLSGDRVPFPTNEIFDVAM
jgi:hypothetical protein